jgi:hypothetical protein
MLQLKYLFLIFLNSNIETNLGPMPYLLKNHLHLHKTHDTTYFIPTTINLNHSTNIYHKHLSHTLLTHTSYLLNKLPSISTSINSYKPILDTTNLEYYTPS